MNYKQYKYISGIDYFYSVVRKCHNETVKVQTSIIIGNVNYTVQKNTHRIKLLVIKILILLLILFPFNTKVQSG